MAARVLDSTTPEAPSQATEHNEAQQPLGSAQIQASLKVAYIVSRFPKLTETFVLFEILALQKIGVDVELYPLLHGKHEHSATAGEGLLRKLWRYLRSPKQPVVMHPEAGALVERAHYQPFVSGAVLWANFLLMVFRPRAYFSTLVDIVRGTWGNANFLVGAISMFPKCALFARQMARDGVTHIHAHFANHPAAAAFVIHGLSGIPYSFTAHGSDLHRDRTMLRDKVRRAAFVATISKYNRDVILGEYSDDDRDKVVVLHCGVDTDVFRPTVRQVESAGRLSLLCVGTLHEVKGQSYLLEACRHLWQRGITFDLHLVGDGPDRAALVAKAAQMNLSEHVIFHGQLTRAEVVDLLHQTDVFVTPSVPTSDGRREGIPVVLMEAMSSGVPVVASRISGIPELVEDEQTGLLVPPRDVDLLADAVERLHNDSDLRGRLGRSARQRILRDFDVHANAIRLAECFRRPDQASMAGSCS